MPNALGNKYRRFRVDDKLLNSNLTTPVLVFSYNNGTEIVSYVHTFHNIDKEINAWGLSGVIQCLKSLCLYYFDGNVLNKPNGFVVDAGKTFNIDDYPAVVQPASPSNYDIVPKSNAGKTLTTVDEVLADIRTRIPADDSTGATPYLIGCNMMDIDYINDTFAGIDSCTTIDEVNRLVSTGDNAKYRFLIGSYYYKFSLSTTNTKEIDACGVIRTAGAVQFDLIA